MTSQTTDTLKEARRIAHGAGLFFVEKADGFRVFRKTSARPVYLGKRTAPAALRSFVSRCATAK